MEIVAGGEDVVIGTQRGPALKIAEGMLYGNRAVEEVSVELVAAEEDTGFAVEELEPALHMLVDRKDLERTAF